MPEPLSRLQLARDEINKTFGPDFAEQHPEVVIAVMNAASSDWAASRLGVAIERVAEALLVEEEATPGRRDAVVAVHGVLRP
jgi:hypothetical protein